MVSCRLVSCILVVTRHISAWRSPLSRCKSMLCPLTLICFRALVRHKDGHSWLLSNFLRFLHHVVHIAWERNLAWLWALIRGCVGDVGQSLWVLDWAVVGFLLQLVTRGLLWMMEVFFRPKEQSKGKLIYRKKRTYLFLSPFEISIWSILSADCLWRVTVLYLQSSAGLSNNWLLFFVWCGLLAGWTLSILSNVLINLFMCRCFCDFRLRESLDSLGFVLAWVAMPPWEVKPLERAELTTVCIVGRWALLLFGENDLTSLVRSVSLWPNENFIDFLSLTVVSLRRYLPLWTGRCGSCMLCFLFYSLWRMTSFQTSSSSNEYWISASPTLSVCWVSFPFVLSSSWLIRWPWMTYCYLSLVTESVLKMPKLLLRRLLSVKFMDRAAWMSLVMLFPSFFVEIRPFLFEVFDDL